jgi:iron complex transport system permease protein
VYINSENNKFVRFGINNSLPKIRIPILLVALFFLLVAIFISAMFGGYKVDFLNLLTFNLSETEETIIFSIRVPRILLAAIVGAALAVSGAVMQGFFRNPLADPSIIGISSGAALFVATVIVLFGDLLSGIWEIYGLSLAAFIGAVFTSLIVFRLASVNGSSSVAYMLLAGIAINAIAAAGTSFLAFISNDEQLRTLTFWTMGSFGGALWVNISVASSIIIPCLIILYRTSKQLNLLLLGDDEARYLGVNIEKVKRKIIILVALIVGASVAVSGIIGFVGLIVPHLLRILYGSDNKFIIPASAIFGAILVLLSDSLARNIVLPTEIPVGIITSLIGGPYFLFLLTKQR